MNNILPYFKVTCENGCSWITAMSLGTSLQKAMDYFIGRFFDTAPYPGETMSKAIKVEQLN
jgi:hypothetical protein